MAFILGIALTVASFFIEGTTGWVIWGTGTILMFLPSERA